MDFSDVSRVNQLSTEKLIIQRAIEIMTSGGQITAMTVTDVTSSTEPHTPSTIPSTTSFTGPLFGGGSFATRNSATVQTSYIAYPPAMVDAIKAAFEARLHTIEDELSNLGVTGLPNR